MSKIASTMPPRSGSELPTSVMQSVCPRRVHNLRMRRALGRRPISSSITPLMSRYAPSTRVGSPLTPGMKNAATSDQSPRLRASFASAAPIAPGWIWAWSSAINLACRSDSGAPSPVVPRPAAQGARCALRAPPPGHPVRRDHPVGRLVERRADASAPAAERRTWRIRAISPSRSPPGIVSRVA